MTEPAIRREGFGRRVMRALVGGDQQPDLWFAIPMTAAYLALLIVAHQFHESWRDEIHCWMVGSHARGLWDLLTGIRRYDGHPFLWYEVLHLTSRIIPSILGLHVITIVLATLAGYLWLAYGSLPRPLRLLGLASYYLIFEYTVICRGYVLGLFLLFAFCAVYDMRRPRYLTLFGLLALLAATSVYGTIIASSLALFLSLQELRAWRVRLLPDRLMESDTRRWLIGCLIFGLALAVVVATTMPPKDEYFAQTWNTDFTFKNVTGALQRWWIAVFPKPKTTGTWEMVPTGLGLRTPEFVAVLSKTAAAALLLFLLAMKDNWPAAVAYASVVGVMSLFQESRNIGDVRHWGHFFVALLACLWLAFKAKPRGRINFWIRIATYVALGALFLLHDFTGYIILRNDFAHPFSGSVEAARFIRRAGLQDAAFVGEFDHLASAVTGILDRPFASGNNGEIGYTVVFHKRRHGGNIPETLRLTRQFLKENPARPVVLILTWDFPVSAAPVDMLIEPLLVTKPSLHPEERFHLFRVTPKAPDVSPTPPPAPSQGAP